MFQGNTDAVQDICETWDGSSWTETADCSNAKKAVFGDGTTTSALSISGRAGPSTKLATVESCNGSAWSEVGDVNTARQAGGCVVTSNQEAFIYAGYISAVSAVAEDFDGVAWTEVADLSTARDRPARAGNVDVALAAGGNTGSVSNATEEWNMAVNVKTITD